MSKSFIKSFIKSTSVATAMAIFAVTSTTAIAQVAVTDNNSVRSTSSVSSINSVVPTVFKTTPIFYGTDGEYPFSSAVRTGNTLYLSGQMGLKDGELVSGGVGAQTEQTLDNINATLLRYGYQKSDLVKCMVMLTDMDKFGEFNEAYKSKLASPYPARSAFEVSNLALGGQVEIECIAVK